MNDMDLTTDDNSATADSESAFADLILRYLDGLTSDEEDTRVEAELQANPESHASATDTETGPSTPESQPTSSAS